MKKIFTLIAVAAMAISANAQSYQIQKDEAPKAGDKITSVANITMTYGASGDTDFKAAKSNGDDLKAASGYVARTDGNGVNPVDGDNKSWARGGGVPTKGTFYLFEPTTDGKLEVFVICNDSKVFTVLEDGVNIATSLSAINVKGYGEDGVAIDGLTFSEEGRADADTQGLVFNNKVYGTVTFDVKAGKKYHVFVCASKLGFGGFKFPAGGEAGINTVKAVEAENGAAYNLAGQKVADGFKGVVIKNGKKMIQK